MRDKNMKPEAEILNRKEKLITKEAKIERPTFPRLKEFLQARARKRSSWKILQILAENV